LWSDFLMTIPQSAYGCQLPLHKGAFIGSRSARLPCAKGAVAESD